MANQGKSSGFGTVVKVLVGITVLGCGCLSLAVIVPANIANQQRRAEEARLAALPPAQPVNEACAQVAAKFSTASGLSELQKTELWKEYEGREFRWSMQMVEVDDAVLGGYRANFKCQGSASLVQDVVVEFPKEWKTSLLQMKKGESYEIHGRFRRTSTFFGISAEIVPDR